MILRCAKCRRLLGYENEPVVPPNKSKAILIDKCDCGRSEEESIRKCWYQMETTTPLIHGIFHGWGSLSTPANKSNGDLVQDSIGLIETDTGLILSIPVNQIQFREPSKDTK